MHLTGSPNIHQYELGQPLKKLGNFFILKSSFEEFTFAKIR